MGQQTKYTYKTADGCTVSVRTAGGEVKALAAAFRALKIMQHRGDQTLTLVNTEIQGGIYVVA